MSSAARYDRPHTPDELAGWLADLCGQHTGRSPQRSGSGWSVRCPAHKDKNPSLSISPGSTNEDAAVIHCHAGCTPRQICASLGITEADLFIPKPLPRISPPPVTVINPSSPPATYTYTDEHGTVVGQVVRTADKKFWRRRPEGAGWVNGGFGDILYNQHRLARATDDQVVFIVEGEKDVDRLTSLGLLATCNVGGAGKWRPEMAAALEGHPVVILPDNDQPGRDHANAVAASLLQRSSGEVRIINLPDLPDKGDVSDWLDAGHSIDELRDLYASTPPLSIAPLPAEAARSSEEITTVGWQPVDLAPYLADDYQPPQTDLGLRTDGTGLFYAGRTHSLSGPPESGKTWIALFTASQEILAGNHVVLLDFENSPDDIVNKLRLFSVPDEIIAGQVSYIQPDRPLTQADADQLRSHILTHDVRLVVIDGVTNVMGIHGLNPNDNSDYSRFDQMLPASISRLGPAVVMVDHVAKNAGEGNRYAIGAQHKLGSITGAAYLVDVNRKHPFAPGRRGEATITISKDRPGAVRSTHPTRAGTFILDSSQDPPAAHIEPPSDGSWRPTNLMEKISLALEQVGGPLSQRGLEQLVPGKSVHVRKAIAALIQDGHIVISRGDRGAIMHELKSPYREPQEGV